MDEVRREAIDRLDQALMTVSRMIEQLPQPKGKRQSPKREQLLGLQEDITYARSVLERFSIPFRPNR